MIANYFQTNVSVNCLQKVSMSCPKTVSMSCLVDELSRFRTINRREFIIW